MPSNTDWTRRRIDSPRAAGQSEPLPINLPGGPQLNFKGTAKDAYGYFVVMFGLGAINNQDPRLETVTTLKEPGMSVVSLPSPMFTLHRSRSWAAP